MMTRHPVQLGQLTFTDSFVLEAFILKQHAVVDYFNCLEILMFFARDQLSHGNFDQNIFISDDTDKCQSSFNVFYR